MRIQGYSGLVVAAKDAVGGKSLVPVKVSGESGKPLLHNSSKGFYCRLGWLVVRLGYVKGSSSLRL